MLGGVGMSAIDRFELKLDQVGHVIPAEYFTGNGKKNYIAHILGRDPQYTWRRQWLQRVFSPGKAIPRFKKEAFIIGEVYEIHASFLPTPVQEIEMKRTGEFDKEAWKKDRMNRVNSKYNGFWKVVDITETAVRMERLYSGDMNQIFPKQGTDGDQQATLDEFFRSDEVHEL